MPLEQARQAFEEIKALPPTPAKAPVIQKRRKLRIIVEEKPNE